MKKTNKNETLLLEKFKVEELEKRYEMGWTGSLNIGNSNVNWDWKK